MFRTAVECHHALRCLNSGSLNLLWPPEELQSPIITGFFGEPSTDPYRLYRNLILDSPDFLAFRPFSIRSAL